VTLPPPSEHFQGKSVAEHLKEAREKGAFAKTEVHGIEMPGHLSAGADAAKETSIALVFLWILCSYFFPFKQTVLFLGLFSGVYLFWKVGRSALLGWARLERLHRLIEEERWEIQHHRHQEREELKELYQLKGFSGKLLEEVVDVLMSDDNRLLKVMLEEELNLSLESFEHPLKQSLGAGVGVAIAAFLSLAAYWFFPFFGLPLVAGVVLLTSAFISARLERNRPLPILIWHLALFALCTGLLHVSLLLIFEGQSP
jgi:hypothetical protein